MYNRVEKSIQYASNSIVGNGYVHSKRQTIRGSQPSGSLAKSCVHEYWPTTSSWVHTLTFIQKSAVVINCKANDVVVTSLIPKITSPSLPNPSYQKHKYFVLLLPSSPLPSKKQLTFSSHTVTITLGDGWMGMLCASLSQINDSPVGRFVKQLASFLDTLKQLNLFEI